jgi:hypothetical protein
VQFTVIEWYFVIVIIIPYINNYWIARTYFASNHVLAKVFQGVLLGVSWKNSCTEMIGEGGEQLLNIVISLLRFLSSTIN